MIYVLNKKKKKHTTLKAKKKIDNIFSFVQ